MSCLFDPGIPRIEIDDLELVYVESLQDVINLLAGQQLMPLLPAVEMIEESKVSSRDFNLIIGHIFAKRALEIAASDGHYVLMDGPPGCGKSLLVKHFQPSCRPFRKSTA